MDNVKTGIVSVCGSVEWIMASEPKLLTLYSDVDTKIVKWVWFPYIASGKITLIQGDPGDGKSTMMMHIIAELTTGGAMPDGTAMGKPQRVIYQCSEDGVGDTIKPRLVKIGATVIPISKSENIIFSK